MSEKHKVEELEGSSIAREFAKKAQDPEFNFEVPYTNVRHRAVCL